MKEIKIKQNKNTHSILYHIFVWIFAVAFVFALFFCPNAFDILRIPAFAYNDPEPDWSDQPIPYFVNNSDYVAGTGYRWSDWSDNNGSFLYTYGSTDVPVYAFVYGSSAPYTLCCCWEPFVSGSFTIQKTKSSDSQYVSTSFGSYNSDYNLRWTTISQSGIGSNIPFNCPYFTNVIDGLSSVRDVIDNPPSTDTLSTISFTLPSGNIAFIDLGANSYNQQRTYSGSCDFEYLSNIFNGQFQYDSGKWGYSSSLPTSSQFSYPTTPMEWAKSGKLNILGQSQYGHWHQVSTASSRYLVIYNPVNELSMLSDGVPRECIYSISIPDAVSVRVYPLTVNSVFENNIFTQTDTLDSDDYFDGTVDPDTGVVSWSDASGNSSSGPVFGGNTNVGTNAETIFDVVRNIAEEIRSFLSGSVSSVRTLINAASDFFHSISDLYIWLPAPVYSVLVSALVVAVTIGVIKVFL